jgi:hypothetical protein
MSRINNGAPGRASATASSASDPDIELETDAEVDHDVVDRNGRTSGREPLPLGRYAFVTAALSEGYALPEILEREGLSEDDWEEAEEHWVERLEESAETDLQVHDELDRALAAARAQFARKVAPLDTDVMAFLTFQRLLLAAPRPLPFLREHELFFGDWLRLQEVWAERLSADGETRASAAKALAEADSRALPAIEPGPRVWPAASGDGGKPARVAARAMVEGAGEPVVQTIAWGLAGLRGESSTEIDAPVPVKAPESSFPAPAPAPVPAPAPHRSEELAPPMTDLPDVFSAEMTLPPSTLEPLEIAKNPLPFQPVKATASSSAPPRNHDVGDSPSSAPVTAPQRAVPPPEEALPFRPNPPDAHAHTSAPMPASQAAPAEQPAETTLEGPTIAVEPALPFNPPGASGQARMDKAPVADPPRPSAPSLTLERYASLCAELAVFPTNAESIFAKYGLAALRDRLTTDLVWQERLRQDPASYRQWQESYKQAHAYWLATAR